MLSLIALLSIIVVFILIEPGLWLVAECCEGMD
jgi:hypothetical protein